MDIKDLMTKNPQLIVPETPIGEAARLMFEAGVGSLFIQKDDKLIGVITDRDIVTRALANGKDHNTQVQDIMSKKVLYCFDNDSLESIKMNFEKNQVRRLAVLNKDKRLVGIISMTDFEKKFPRTFAFTENGCAEGKFSGEKFQGDKFPEKNLEQRGFGQQGFEGAKFGKEDKFPKKT